MDGCGDEGELVSQEEAEAQMERWPPVKSPTLSRWAGLGYGQAQVRDSLETQSDALIMNHALMNSLLLWVPRRSARTSC